MPGPNDPNDPNNFYENNAMQRNAGLTQPFMPQPPQFMTPGQFSSGLAASFRAPQMQGGMFPNAFATPIPTFTNSSPFLQGPGGVLMPMNPAAMSNPAGGVGNPYMQGAGRFSGGSIYQPSAPAPPPSFYGPTGNVHPFSTVPGAQFDTPFQWNAANNMATAETSAGFNSFGHSLGARFAGNAVGGFAGAAAGMKMGGGLGGMAMGAAAGFVGAEMMGAGRFAQNAYMRNFGMRDLNESSYASGIANLSRQFVSGGPDGDAGGQGFSYVASRRAARALDDMSNSSSFRRETFNKFNTADVMKITQEGVNNGMMTGVGSPEQMRDRVKSLAKTLSSFMELAQDPDIRSAFQTMGNMQLQGLNQPQTLNAVRNGRAFARMAGTNFQQMAELGGGIGAQTFQSVGLTQGLGFQTGSMNLGMAQNSINRGIVGTQLGNLVGGAQGLGAMNTMASAGFLQSPVLAPAMMSASGGLNTNALQSLISGGGNPMRMANMGAGNMSGIAGRMGPEGLAMALSMQPLLQDSIGRAMQASGPFAQRNVEDRSAMRLMTQMGSRGSAGFMQSARLMGMSESQAIARTMEMGSPGHFNRQFEAIDTQRLERNAETRRDRAAQQPTLFDEVSHASTTVSGARRAWNNAGRTIQEGWDDAFSGPQAYRSGDGRSEESAREARDYYRSRSYRNVRDRAATRAARSSDPAMSSADGIRHDMDIAGANGSRGVAAWLGGFGNMSSDRRRAELGLITERAGIAQTLLNTNAMSQGDLRSNTDRYFGGNAGARTNVAMDMARAMSMDAQQTHSGLGERGGVTAGNVAVRGAAGMLTGGLLDPGNIAGGRAFNPHAIRDAYVNRMVQGGTMSQSAAESMYRRNATGIQQTASQEFRMLATPEELRNATAAGALAGRGTPGRSMASQADEISDEGFRGIYGDDLKSSTHTGGIAQRRLISEMDNNWRGVGRTPEEILRNRGTMTSMATLRAVIRGGNKDEARRAQTQLGAVMRDASRRGVDVGAMYSQVERYRGDASQQARQLELGRSLGNRSGEDIARAFGNNSLTEAQSEGIRDEGHGYERLANQGGILAKIYRTDGRTSTQAEVAQNMRNLTDDERSQLARQSRTQAEIARKAARGENIDNDVSGAGRALGVAEKNARRSFQNSEQERMAPMRAIRSIGRSLGLLDTEDEAVNRAVSGGTRADGSAIDQTGDAAAAQEAARAAGIGGVNDQMVEAARDLKRAAELFSSVVESGALDSLTNNINGSP